ncbi:unnamed protein product [Soboliphyme baturini]|uniref:Ribosome assembly factor mrt4 n=1 Tax=Soboliphyme baturini TaxID=241478 RepID=A0A183J5V5_9BILA|nr:unnamed protein product [Soboliphyme baturini]
MPKSKRDKEVSLTKVKKKGRLMKENLMKEVRKLVDLYSNIVVFTVHNSRSSRLAELRKHFSDDRFLFGRNKVIAAAFGKTSKDECHLNLSKVGKQLIGQCGIMFTNRPLLDVAEFFKSNSVDEYARSGSVAAEAFKIDAGPLEQFQFSIEPYLRKLGMPTVLERGIIKLPQEYTVCEKGDILTPEAAKILVSVLRDSFYELDGLNCTLVLICF